MLQLNPPIPVLTPRGKGMAHVLLDYSQEHDLCWVVFLDDSRECWTYPNRDVRAQENMSLGRPGRRPLPGQPAEPAATQVNITLVDDAQRAG